MKKIVYILLTLVAGLYAVDQTLPELPSIERGTKPIKRIEPNNIADGTINWAAIKEQGKKLVAQWFGQDDAIKSGEQKQK